ncbi:MAG: Ig-like domain-containing protein [Bacteroidales bacterium]|nr:Ig-like domain-containing protein [Bacteroidales bacterium]
MKKIKLFSMMILAAGLFVSCDKVDISDSSAINSTLTASPSSQKIGNDGTAAVTFKLTLTNHVGIEEDVSKYTATITFEAAGGTVSPASATADANGQVHVTFTATDPNTFTGGTIVGKVIKLKENGDDLFFQQGDLATATATILPLDGDDPEDNIVDEGLKKANELKDNTYEIEDNVVTVEDLPEGEGMRDYIVYGEKKQEGVTKVFFIEFAKEHPTYATVGGGTVHITPDMINKEIDMLAQTPDALAWMNLFSLKDVNQGYNEETNPSASVTAGSTEGNAFLQKATCKVAPNNDGSYTALAYFKTKDGKEAYFKMRATRKASWSD